MAQHDYDIANQSGANFRTDLNNALDAIVSNNSGSSAPSTTFAYEWWIDTSNNLLKLRNSANNAWITLPLSITADNSTSGALTVNGNLTTTGTVDINGQELILDADADTSITADSDDQIDFRVGAVDVMTLTNSHLVLKGTTPKITIGDGGEEDTALIFDGNAQDFYIGLDDSADDLIIGKGSTVGTTPAIVIDENLNIGIGTTPSLGALHLKSATTDIVTFENTDAGTTGAQLLLYHNSSSPADGDRVGAIAFQGEDDGGNHTTFGGIRCLATDVSDGSEDGTLTFSTTRASSFTEAMRITENGQIGIGVTSPTSNGGTGAGLIHVHAGSWSVLHTTTSASGTTANDGAIFGMISDDIYVYNYETAEVLFGVGGSTVGKFASNGDFYTNNGSVSSLSDKRIKKNITSLTEGLDVVKKLNPINFEYCNTYEGQDKNGLGIDDGRVHKGFIADEVQEVAPSYVEETTGIVLNEKVDDLKTLSMTAMIPMLVKAIQEQQEQIEVLQSEVKTLKGE